MVFVLFTCVVLFIDHTVALVRGANADKCKTREQETMTLLDRRMKEQVHAMLMESRYLESMYVKHVELKLKLIEKEKSMARSIREAEERMKLFVNESERNMYVALEPFLNDSNHTICYVHELIDYIEIGLSDDQLNILHFMDYTGAKGNNCFFVFFVHCLLK